MCSEADRALHRSHALYQWYDFGRTLALLRLRTMITDKIDDISCFDELFCKAQQLTKEYPKKIPILESLLELALNPATKPFGLLQTVLGEERNDILTGESSGPAVGGKLYLPYVSILNQLARLTRTPDCSAQKPSWVGERSALIRKGGDIRQFKAPEKNQKDLIEAFDRQKWARSLPDPFNDREKLHKTITDLNKSLVPGTIRFGGDGTGEGVRWEPAT